MMRYTIIAHHGSPGVGDDFQYFKETFSEHEFLTPERRELYQPEELTTKYEEIILIGYSFGCLQALKDAQYFGKRVKKLILISPFLYGGRTLSSFSTALISVPFLGDWVLKKIARKAIPQMLINSSFPASVSEDYLEQGKIYENPEVLRSALLEKKICSCLVPKLLKSLAEHDIPITLIRGKDDTTSTEKSQILPLKEVIRFHEVVLPEAGHALPWTHKEQILHELKKEIPSKEAPKVTRLTPSKERPYGYHQGLHELNNVYSFLQKHLDEHPHRPFLTWVPHDEAAQWIQSGMKGGLPHKKMSAKQLAKAVDLIAAGFEKMGIKSGDRVIIFVSMSFLLYASMFALQKLGAVAVFLESWARRDQFGLILETARPKALISVEQAYDFLSQMPEVYNLIPLKICAGPAKKRYDAHIEDFVGNNFFTRLRLFLDPRERTKAQAVAMEHTALITFTTGSTGTPKGADRTHRFLAAQHYALKRHLPYRDDDVDLPVFPVFSLNNMAQGVTTVIPAINLAQLNETDAAVLYTQMMEMKVTCATLSPSLFNALSAYCKAHNFILPLRRIITGGAPVSRDDLLHMKEVAPQAEILVLYGSTEVEPMAHIEAKDFINLKTKAMEDSEWVDEGVNVGRFDSGLRVRFLKIHPEPISIEKASDWEALLVDEGKVGEIIVAGEHVCQGYYNNEDAFLRAKIKDENGVIWHRTGDLGRLDKNRDLWLVGRINNVIVRNNDYVFPVRAEIILKKLPFVERAAYLGLPDKALGEKTVCALTTKNHERNDEFEKEIRRIMEKNGVPVDEVLFLESIPLDPRHHSKVEYAQLKKQILES